LPVTALTVNNVQIELRQLLSCQAHFAVCTVSPEPKKTSQVTLYTCAGVGAGSKNHSVDRNEVLHRGSGRQQ